jgi:hypothetical protein
MLINSQNQLGPNQLEMLKSLFFSFSLLFQEGHPWMKNRVVFKCRNIASSSCVTHLLMSKESDWDVMITKRSSTGSMLRKVSGM